MFKNATTTPPTAQNRTNTRSNPTHPRSEDLTNSFSFQLERFKSQWSQWSSSFEVDFHDPSLIEKLLLSIIFEFFFILRKYGFLVE